MRLGLIADIRRGFTTGANEFFYLDGDAIRRWGIEARFLKPVIKSPRESKKIALDGTNLAYRIFFCHSDKAELAGTGALEYIIWGEKSGYNRRPSCCGRARWWEARLEAGNSVFVKEANDSSAVYYNPDGYPVDCRLYCADLPLTTLVFLNSAVAAMMYEVYNRAGLGEGARSLMVNDYAMVPALSEGIAERAAKALIRAIADLPPRKLTSQVTAAWAELDTCIFDILNLSKGERDAVYEAVINLVEARLKKAESV